jgi:hypothetical protein
MQQNFLLGSLPQHAPLFSFLPPSPVSPPHHATRFDLAVLLERPSKGESKGSLFCQKPGRAGSPPAWSLERNETNHIANLRPAPIASLQIASASPARPPVPRCRRPPPPVPSNPTVEAATCCAAPPAEEDKARSAPAATARSRRVLVPLGRSIRSAGMGGRCTVVVWAWSLVLAAGRPAKPGEGAPTPHGPVRVRAAAVCVCVEPLPIPTRLA